MSDINYLMQFAKVSGFRLVVLASRLACENDFQREMHGEVAELLEREAQSMRACMARERQVTPSLIGPPDQEDYWRRFIEDAEDIDGDQPYELLDRLEIDHDTMEYRVNDEGWSCAYSADCDGYEISYPRIVDVGRDELGSLAEIIADIHRETYVRISVKRVVYD